MELSKKATAVFNYLEEQANKHFESQRERGVYGSDMVIYLIYMGELRDHFSSDYIDEFLDYYEEVEKKGWGWSGPSHTQDENPRWVLDNVNNLYKHRGSIMYYIYKRGGNRTKAPAKKKSASTTKKPAQKKKAAR